MFKQSNSGIIPGIDQYCDRWCERCAFTSRCVVFVRSGGSVISQGQDHATVWKDVSNQLASAITLLQKAAAERGIVLEPPSAEELAQMATANQRKESIRKAHPLTALSLKYIQLADDLLEEQDWLEQKAAQWQQQLTLGIADEATVNNGAALLKESLEVVQWYLMQINVKLSRAVSSFDNGLLKDKFMRDDANGSAKVALIGIERSMVAWQHILLSIPEIEDAAIPILALLQQLRQLVENHFPKARAFKRPGFDD